MEDVVDEMQQRIGILQDDLTQFWLVLRGCYRVELGHVIQDGVHRGADLLDHIPHETVLRVIHLLYLRRLYLQSFLEVEQVGYITQQSKILYHFALFVMERFQIELDSQRLTSLGT